MTIKLTESGVFLNPNGTLAPTGDIETARQNAMAYQILQNHNHSGNMDHLQLKFDALLSPDNNYVSILQTARASGLKKFPVPYVLSNCHNSLCGVGGTINEDDHMFGLDNAKKFGGIFVPRFRAVLHQYMREMYAGGGKMILGSDSHARYGALGTMGIGEGGGEVVKQLVGRTYDLPRPPIVAVVLSGTPKNGVGPMDVALTLIGATFKSGFLKNKIIEVLGDGISNLSAEFRMGIDVMTTESAALSSIWATDEVICDWLTLHNRGHEYKKLAPAGVTYYDSMIELDLSSVECMMALPFHPSNVVSIREFNEDPEKYIADVEAEGNHIKGGGAPFHLMEHLTAAGMKVDQAMVSGCGGGMFENLSAMADILDGHAVVGNGPVLGINPASQPVNVAMIRSGISDVLGVSGAVIYPASCGCCFGVSDIPADNQISIRHVTRNYPNREGSKPRNNQMAATILMDARSIAATVRNGGILTPATDLDVTYHNRPYVFEGDIYENQVFNNFEQGDNTVPLRMGPNISPWPEMHAYSQHLLLQVVGNYEGSVTTDELVPSGDATAYRSNPEKFSDYTMISRDEGYRDRARTVRTADRAKRAGETIEISDIATALATLAEKLGCTTDDIMLGSLMISDQIGDGSSREQAASNQKVLGGLANLATEYATKRYRSNLINWGILPMQLIEARPDLKLGDFVYVENVPSVIQTAGETFTLRSLDGTEIPCTLNPMTADEKEILSSGSLINYYKTKNI